MTGSKSGHQRTANRRQIPAKLPLVLANAPSHFASPKTWDCSLAQRPSISMQKFPRTPKLFQAAAKRVGTSSPAAVINAALASLATEDELGPWLAKNWGVLADTPPELLDQIDL